jgi:hypothetical protein
LVKREQANALIDQIAGVVLTNLSGLIRHSRVAAAGATGLMPCARRGKLFPEETVSRGAMWRMTTPQAVAVIAAVVVMVALLASSLTGSDAGADQFCS